MTTDRGPEGVHGAGRRRDRLGPGEGRRDDAARLRDHALLRADRRRGRRPRRRAAPRGRAARSSGSRVDGQMSTNDTVLLQATGEAGVPLPDGLLDAVLLQLALEIVADGEGATRVGRIEAREAADADEADRVARAIANSPLVKTALYGRDPNWGRIAQAAGMALAGEQLAELGPGGDRRRSAGRRGRGGGDRGQAGPRRSFRAHVLLRPQPRVRADQRGVHNRNAGHVLRSASNPWSAATPRTSDAAPASGRAG